MAREDWIWHGTAGHFIGAPRCCFHLHTRVGDKRISTVGCYHPEGSSGEPREIGSGRLYETMVFDLDEEGMPVEWLEQDADTYDDENAAREGHLAMCLKYDNDTNETKDTTT